MAKKGKLHELLAVEGDLENAAKKIMGETIQTFTKKQDHFSAFIRTLTMFDENRQNENTTDRSELTTTVDEKLDYTQLPVVRWFDALLQKEATNQLAKADLVVDGVTIAEQLPATFLLGMESRLNLLRQVFNRIPTLPPNIKWEKDDGMGKNVFRSVYPEEAFKTEKKFKVQVLYEAKFPKAGEGGQSIPAQVDKIPETENIGKYEKTHWSGMVSPARKAELMSRIDKLIRAVKKARQKANATDQVKLKVGSAMFDYINGK